MGAKGCMYNDHVIMTTMMSNVFKVSIDLCDLFAFFSSCVYFRLVITYMVIQKDYIRLP